MKKSKVIADLLRVVIGFACILDGQSSFANDFGMIAKGTFSEVATVENYEGIRSLLREYGVEKFYSEMETQGIFGNRNILPAERPFNALARILSGQLTPAYPLDLLERRSLEQEAREFLIAKNKPDLEARWQEEVEVGKPLASMSLHHEFLVPRDPNWTTFNILTFGINGSVAELEGAIALLKRMKAIGLASASADGWGENVGVFFHCFPFNSVNTLHMHIVDLNHVGPSFHVQKHKNLSVDIVLEQLGRELRNAHERERSRVNHLETPALIEP